MAFRFIVVLALIIIGLFVVSYGAKAGNGSGAKAGKGSKGSKAGKGSNMAKGCRDEGPCDPNPCEHDGVCTPAGIEIDGDFSCACQPGWLAKRCDIQDLCISSPCLNDGQCYLTGDNLDTVGCFCPEPYTGDNCGCPHPLGMADGSIPDDSIRASSHWLDNVPSDARLDGPNAWVKLGSDTDPWIEADIGFQVSILGIVSQGGRYYWVTTLKISTFLTDVQTDSGVFIQEGDTDKIFNANTDVDTHVNLLFDAPVFARILRIWPLSSSKNTDMRMRFEILGCAVENVE